MNRDEIFGIVKESVTLLNEELEYDHLRSISDETQLFGGDEGIDSLSLVRLVVDLEGRAQKRFGRSVQLSDEKAMSARTSPFRTVGSLVDFISSRLEGPNA